MTEEKMNNYEKLSKAFEIFLKYSHKPYVSADHDVLYAGPSPGDVSEEDQKKLDELGWFPNKDFDCFQKFV